MNKHRSFDDWLADIVTWGERVASYRQGLSREEFLFDAKTQDAVIRCLEVIGEASAQILKGDPGFEDRHPEMQLSAAYRARNRSAHGYGSVDLGTIWRSVAVACPAIVAAARNLRDADPH